MNIEREITALKQRISDLETNVINLATRTGNRDSESEGRIADNKSQTDGLSNTLTEVSEDTEVNTTDIETLSEVVDEILMTII